MAPTALAYTYCDQADLKALLSDDGLMGRADDDDTGTLDAVETVYITKAINWASARINLFLAPKYDQADLATDWVVNQWCLFLAAHNLCVRRGNPVPESLQALYDETLEDLKAVQSGQIQLDIGTREVMWPAWSNVRVDIGYEQKKIRVQRRISERTPTTYPQNRDRLGEFLVEPN